jgi:hypothetical protein
MNLIESLLDETTSAELEDPSEPTIELSESENEVVYPVTVEASELTAYKRLLTYDIEAVSREPGIPESVEDALDESWREAMPSGRPWSGETDRTGETAEAIVDAWSAELSGERGVILMPSGAYSHLARPLWACAVRAEQDEDSLELTDALLTAASFVKRLQSAETGDAPIVFAHIDDIPMTRAEMEST